MQAREKAVLAATGWKLARVCAAVLFGVFALLKLFGFLPFVNIFNGTFETPVARYVVGVVELAGAFLVLTHRFVIPGALILTAVALFAIAHVSAMGHSPAPMLLPLALAACIAVIGLRSRTSYRRSDAHQS